MFFMINGLDIDEHGTKRYYKNNLLHREGRPAIEWPDGSKEWCVNGKLHRLGGPAIEWSDGRKEWWVDGKLYTEQDYPRALTSYKSRLLSEILASCP